MNRADIVRRREALARELAELDAKEEHLLSLSDDARLAEELHTMQCAWNHTDGCAWYYEISKGVTDWARPSHDLWLKKARKVMKALPEMSVEEILRVAEAVR